nr:uncharacterized protein LOC107454286 [Parasteatoda tepidariorum]
MADEFGVTYMKAYLSCDLELLSRRQKSIILAMRSDNKTATLRKGGNSVSTLRIRSFPSHIDGCHGNGCQQFRVWPSQKHNSMPRIALLPDQLYEENVVVHSEDSDEADDDFREQYAREVRKIRDNIRAIRRIKIRSSRSSAASSSIPRTTRAHCGHQLKTRSVSCSQFEQQRPTRENGSAYSREYELYPTSGPHWLSEIIAPSKYS